LLVRAITLRMWLAVASGCANASHCHISSKTDY
jgi:hypothetical protein